jgi:hypothetical protein
MTCARKGHLISRLVTFVKEPEQAIALVLPEGSPRHLLGSAPASIQEGYPHPKGPTDGGNRKPNAGPAPPRSWGKEWSKELGQRTVGADFILTGLALEPPGRYGKSLLILALL